VTIKIKDVEKGRQLGLPREDSINTFWESFFPPVGKNFGKDAHTGYRLGEEGEDVWKIEIQFLIYSPPL